MCVMQAAPMGCCGEDGFLGVGWGEDQGTARVTPGEVGDRQGQR